MKRRQGFQLRTGQTEAQQMAAKRRTEALAARVATLKSRGNLATRALCRLLGHKPWNTGIAAAAPNGSRYSLAVCERCGARLAVAGESLRSPLGSSGPKDETPPHTQGRH